MPPRYSYWTIIAGGLPTAFRAAEREELMPTFQRLREKHPDAEMKWFARGKLWDSPEAARPPRGDFRDRDARGPRERQGKPPESDRRGSPSGPPERAPRGEHRGRDWRPGGEHRDPRQPFKDAKKARNQRWREEKFERKQRFGDRDRQDRPPREKPHGDPLRKEAGRGFVPREGDRPRGPKGPPRDRRDGPPADRGDRSSGPQTDWRARPPREKPHGDRFARKGGGFGPPKQPHGEREGGWRDRPPRQGSERRPFTDDRRGGPPADQRRGPSGDRGGGPPRDQRGGPGNDRRGGFSGPPDKGWQARPPREKPHGDKFRPKSDWKERPPRRDDDRKGGGWKPGPSSDRNAGPSGSRGGRPDAPAEPREERSRPGPPKGNWRDNLPRDAWRDAPREKPHGDKLGDASGARPFSGRGGFERKRTSEREPGRTSRDQGTEEPKAPPRPRGPNREPRPDENPKPSPPPRPSEPAIPPPGPPERGRLNKNRRPKR